MMEATEMYGIFGGLALAAGIIILLFPKVFFYLIGGYLVLNAVTAFFHGADPLLTLALILAGVLIFLSPGLVAWFVAFYLLVFAALLFFWGFWFLAVPALVIALIIVLLPKIVPLLIGGLLTLAGGLTLLVTIVR